MLEEQWSCDVLLLHVRAKVKPRLFEVQEVQPRWVKSWLNRESANDPRCAKKWIIHPFWPRFVRCTCILKVMRRDLEWHLSRKSRDVCFWWWLKVCENRENKQIRRCGELQMWCHRQLTSHPWTFLPANMKGCVINKLTFLLKSLRKLSLKSLTKCEITETRLKLVSHLWPRVRLASYSRSKIKNLKVRKTPNPTYSRSKIK